MGSALNRMLDHISTALSTRQASETRVRQFVADASHELRTPLTAIRGYTELARRRGNELPEEVAHAMERVASESERMTHLVEDLLLLARLDSGRPLESEQVDLSQLAVDAISDAHIAGPDHVWDLDMPDEPVVVTGDGARLHQVLANLLANARVHTPAGTTVTVSLATTQAEPIGPRRRGDPGRRQRARHPCRTAVRGVRAVRPRRHLAIPTRRQHRAGSGDRGRRRQGAPRQHRAAQPTRGHRIRGPVAFHSGHIADTHEWSSLLGDS